jgi:hypothetical protein
MQIITRLNKLEQQTGADSPVCVCYPQRNTESYIQNLGADAPLDSSPVLIGSAVPDICDRCGKPVEKQIIIIQGVDKTTKERFPGEWEAGTDKQ